MLNQTFVNSSIYGNRKMILVDEPNSTALSCMVANTGVTANAEGKKIVKAGTPVSGSLLERDTPFTVDSSGSNPVGVILHDVDVTEGAANSQVVIFGFIDISKLEEDVVPMIKAAEPNLKMIQLLK